MLVEITRKVAKKLLGNCRSFAWRTTRFRKSFGFRALLLCGFTRASLCGFTCNASFALALALAILSDESRCFRHVRVLVEHAPPNPTSEPHNTEERKDRVTHDPGW